MKGRKLSLQEVLDLEDGSRVWVERDKSVYIKEVDLLIDKDYFYIKLDSSVKDVYEYIEYNNLTIPDKIETPYYSYDIIYKLSEEICNLRSLDLTDENIEMIIEEFMEEK